MLHEFDGGPVVGGSFPAAIWKEFVGAALQQLGVVLAQYPASGTLSSHDRVLLVVAKPLHGVVPGVVGLPLTRARVRLARAKLGAVADADTGRVIAQSPPA